MISKISKYPNFETSFNCSTIEFVLKQAAIYDRLSKLTTQVPAVSLAAAAGGLPAAVDRPTAVILDDKGRTVDDKGQEIQLVHLAPTLKANLRAKKRDELRENLKVGDSLELQDQVSFALQALEWLH